ncbi:MAG: PepSY-associated TM helix domain-containing protein [Cyclobacteriaceae bacterium]
MAKNGNNSFSWRKLFNDFHLWMGIGSGLILFVVCLSGTIYAFRTEIEKLLEPSSFRIEQADKSKRLTTETIFTQLQEEPGGIITSVSIPFAADEPYKVSIKASAEEKRGTTYLVNPYSGEVLGTPKGPASAFFSTVFKLHRWLLMERSTGRIIVGIATIIFVFIILTGWVLWWPRKLRNLKQSLTVKTSANWKRVNHDLHNSLGFYASFLLMIMALSGLCWSFEWYRDGLEAVLGTKVFGSRGGEEVSSQAEADAFPLSVEALIDKSEAYLSYPGDYTIYLPAGEEEAVKVIKYPKVSFAGLTAYDLLKLDQYSGELLLKDIYADRPFNEKISTMIKPIHTGEVFGTFSKILYFLASLIGTSLPVTGVLIWVNKLKKKSRKRQQTSMATS